MTSMHLTIDEQPIIALCTPRGSGAIALLRLSGCGIFEFVDQFSKLSAGQMLQKVNSHTIHYGSVICPQTSQLIDKVLFLVMHAPRTFTGQDTLEITCHNNPLIIDKIIQAALLCGARLALAGEFSKRAVLAEKIDLIQAEAIKELIAAQTEMALKKSLEQLAGSFSGYLAQLELQLVEIIGLAEASFEFLDEEQRDFSFDALVQEKILVLQAHIIKLKQDFNSQKQIKEGVRIALIGSVNVGKSTLFNALVGKDRALVSSIAGTTRDSIDASIIVDGNFWSLIDTAGLRQTGDTLEQEGIARSWKEAALCDLILLVFDASRNLTLDEQALYTQIITTYPHKIICVSSKIDQAIELLPFDDQNYVICKLSARTGVGLDTLKIEMKKKIQQLFEAQQSPFLLNERHFSVICQIEQILQPFIVEPGVVIQYELMIAVLYGALEQLSQLTGKNLSEKIMDKIFGDFCIGK